MSFRGGGDRGRGRGGDRGGGGGGYRGGGGDRGGGGGYRGRGGEIGVEEAVEGTVVGVTEAVVEVEAFAAALTVVAVDEAAEGEQEKPAG